ncbi:uncharacterized protein LOC142221381 isoform X2 [Haematobia irritans]|uniref:uncharacterized protein LOC142221381 isoform X2 n=1 Tax=Haematobia irritans TaxID=7368 RepID=UPI003F4FCBC8
MDARKSKITKVGLLRRLRPELMDNKLKMDKTGVRVRSSSSEPDDEDGEVVEKISVQLKSPLPLGNSNDFDPFILLSEAAQKTLNMEKENKAVTKRDEIGTIAESNSTTVIKLEKALNIKSHKLGSHQYGLKSLSMIDSEYAHYHSDGEDYNNTRAGNIEKGAKALSPSRRRSSSSSSLLSDRCSMHFSKLFGNNFISVMDDENPPTALSKILSIKEFDPLAPQQQLALIIKSIISLSELSQREDNIITVDIDKRRILEFSSMSQEEKKNCRLNPYMDVSNIVVTHEDDEFFTFCLCKHCEEYRELLIHIMVEQFKAAHMVVMLLDVLIKAYGPMLKNITAYNKFEKLLDSNKEIYWITCGVIYHKKGEHLDFIYDEYLSDNMIFVLFSSILMLNNPLLLLQILAFHMECIVKAYAEGFLEILEPDLSKFPAEEMINYILNGYDDLMRISEHVASYLFAFENDFLRKFSLTWKLLCQRLYHQHVHLVLEDTMLACIITLKEEEMTSHHTELIKRYIQFDDTMNYVEKRWTDIWIELNKFNLSEVERKRRKSLLDVYHIFDTVVQDAIAFSLQDSIDDNDFYDFRSLKNRRLAWKNIMSYTKMKWPDGFYQPPNTLVVDDRCKKCNISLEYHAEYCKCITCSIAGGPMPPRRNADNKCSKCLAQEIVEKDVNFYDSKIVNFCANDDFQNFAKCNGAKGRNSVLQDVGQELNSSLTPVDEISNENGGDVNPLLPEDSQSSEYHIAWAVFNHLNNRRRFPNATIDKDHFCSSCTISSCRLARKILSNNISPSLSQDLIHYFQPMSMSREELRSILPNIMLYNRKLVASNNGLNLIDVHDLVVKIYWIFIISVYAIYFIDYGDECSEDQDDNFNIDALELVNNDINVNVEKIVGNKDDTKFLEFLDKIKSFDATINIDSEEIQKKLGDILNMSEKAENSFQLDNKPHSDLVVEEKVPIADVDVPNTVDSEPKKTCLACKSKKLTGENAEIGGDRFKEHFSKKRLKKDCSHLRMIETRERLRKKISQIEFVRKNVKASSISKQIDATPPNISTENQSIRMDNWSDDELKLYREFQQKLPEYLQNQPLEVQCILGTFEKLQQEQGEHEKFKDMYDCLEYLRKNDPMYAHKKSQKLSHEKSASQASLEPPSKKSNVSNNSTRDVSTSSQGTKCTDHNYEYKSDSTGKSCTKTSPEAPSKNIPLARTTTGAPSSTSAPGTSTTKTLTKLDFVSEICEIIDNYSKEQAKRKWIKETLSFIEGPTSASGKKKSQPQTSNPKKAAKKAKQKQRRDEEKRIAELQDLRGQFQNIYFKEFTEKLKLKSQKANKKRDKKKISEMENNIKNLQRAKAKVESAILELIATVKQTNTEFKFSYLPTKEQQVEKIKEFEGHTGSAKENLDSAESNSIKESKIYHTNDAISSSPPFTMTQSNNMNIIPEVYSMPYAHANHFPYNLGFPPPAAPAPFGLMRATPMCYAPPPSGASAHQQQLGSDVVAAMAANATSSSNDPSKRIVTIRRVNLPNVPEPQVTVTAKGRSPDKDKLLYTFINGQLVQTGATPPTPMPIISSVQPTTPGPPPKLSSEHLLTIPSPPSPKLSKTQMKKERRRLAKLQAEQSAAEEAEKKRLEEENQRLEALEDQKQKELKQKKEQTEREQKKQNKKKRRGDGQNLEKQINIESTLQSAKRQNKTTKNKNSYNSNCTTSVSTYKTNDSPLQLPQILMTQKNSKQQRSVSTTTSCSAITSSSSTNSSSSQMNTRDNSVSSLKPGYPKEFVNKKVCNELSITPSNSSNLKVSDGCRVNSKKKHKNHTKITCATASSEDDDGGRTLLQTFKSNHDHQCKTKVTKNLPKIKQNLNSKTNGILPVSSDTEDGDYVENSQLHKKTKPSKVRRPKFIDNGQFDNNPFKSLHMQDSDTDWSSSTEDADLGENEQELEEKNMRLTTKTHVGLDSEKVLNKKETKTLKSASQNSNQFSKKNSEREVKDEKSKESLTTQAKNKNSTNTNLKIPQKEKQVSNRSTIKQYFSQPDELSRMSSNSKHMSKNAPATHQETKKSNNNKTKHEKRSNVSNTPEQNYKPITSNPNRLQVKNVPRKSNRNVSNSHQTSDDTICNQKVSTVVAESKNKRSQRNKKFQQNVNNHSQVENCCSGIPNNMGYFNVNEVNMIPTTIPVQTLTAQSCSYQSLAEQMQAMHLHGSHGGASKYQNRTTANNNVSIMDQLNNGVQVENLALPPGITLTKVDPIKSEQLRQKSESIKKLAKPLQQQTTQTAPAFHHSAMGATIIAPPIAPMSNYFNSPYAANAIVPTALDSQSGIIMVEANPPKTSSSTGTACTKQSKNKKRRNKSKANNIGGQFSLANTGHQSTNQENNCSGNSAAPPKMITLRNPMFHGGPTTTPTTPIVKQSGLMQGRPVETYPIAAPLPVDQPAAIIKNENGMYTIRNPALHQAVTSGLVLGGYRQFGNANFYTPQEAAAEAARATLQQQSQHSEINKNTSATSFSYFSNDIPSSHNNISISCTSVAGNSNEKSTISQSSGGGLTGQAAVIQRPTPKCISAIGSEIKSAQQQKQKSKEQHWSHFVADTLPTNKTDNITCSKPFMGSVAEGTSSAAGVDLSLQEKYQQSKYYNGFDVFSGNSGGSGSSTSTGPHIHHSCGDDSPPPSITGYNSYLDGIPNTGVIRYDDASFLKNLIPGQKLNTEVSIHNVNDSNFARNALSPQVHRVEITPVFCNNRPPSTNLFEANTPQNNSTNFRGNYRDHLSDYSNDPNIYSDNNIHMNLTEIETSIKFDFESSSSPSVTNIASSDNHNSILDLNNLLNNKNGPTGSASHRTSPYLDENTLDGFVQNMNTLRISSTTTSADEQSSQINDSGVGHKATSSNASNGWW